MLIELSSIIAFCLVAVVIGIVLYKPYIRLLHRQKIQQHIRDGDMTGDATPLFQKLHGHKAGTPTMGGGLFLLIMGIMIGISLILSHFDIISYSLLNKQESFRVVFGFFAMGGIGVVDDILNVTNYGSTKGLTATAKIVSTFLVAGFLAVWFYRPLGIDYINLRPFAGEVHIGIFAPILFFGLTIAITNAINFVDGLDGLSGGMMTIVFFVLGIIAFMDSKYLITTLIGIMIAVLCAFLRYNIAPAKIFMGDAGAFAMGGMVSVILLILNMKIGILIPFMILFALFRIDFLSSALQLFRKKYFKRKLFAMAPFHHLLEHKGRKERTIVMKARMLQGILAAMTLILMFYQFA